MYYHPYYRNPQKKVPLILGNYVLALCSPCTTVNPVPRACILRNHTTLRVGIIGWVPKIRGTILGVPIRRIIVFGSMLGSPNSGKLPIAVCRCF